MKSTNSLSVNARPTKLAFDPTQTAVIVVDMQNDFLSEGGMFALAGADISLTRAVIGPISHVVDAARAAGSRVIYLRMEFRPDLSDLGAPDSYNRMKHEFWV